MARFEDESSNHQYDYPRIYQGDGVLGVFPIKLFEPVEPGKEKTKGKSRFQLTLKVNSDLLSYS